MNNLKFVQTKDAYYENKEHYDKKYTLKAPNYSKVVLKEHEFLFVKNNIDAILKEVSAITTRFKNNPNLCFEHIYNFFQSFMLDFLDGFFGVVFDAHILKTNDKSFNKEYFLKNILQETECWPNKYNEEILQKCVHKDFPKYVLLENNSVVSYLFIRQGWMELLLDFLKKFKISKQTTSQQQTKKFEVLEDIASESNIYINDVQWFDYEFFEKVFYEYAKSLFKWPNNWNECTI